MILCDVCKSNTASVFLTQIVDGKMQKINLCKPCAKEKGIDDPLNFGLADQFLGLGEALEIEKGGPMQKCPSCGFSQADFKKTGRLGCATCYDTFTEGLDSLLKAMHKGTSHIGKIPARLERTLMFNARMKTLQTDLGKAVAEENYETAAEIRDRIKLLEAQLES